MLTAFIQKNRSSLELGTFPNRKVRYCLSHKGYQGARMRIGAMLRSFAILVLAAACSSQAEDRHAGDFEDLSSLSLDRQSHDTGIAKSFAPSDPDAFTFEQRKDLNAAFCRSLLDKTDAADIAQTHLQVPERQSSALSDVGKAQCFWQEPVTLEHEDNKPVIVDLRISCPNDFETHKVIAKRAADHMDGGANFKEFGLGDNGFRQDLGDGRYRYGASAEPCMITALKVDNLSKKKADLLALSIVETLKSEWPTY